MSTMAHREPGELLERSERAWRASVRAPRPWPRERGARWSSRARRGSARPRWSRRRGARAREPDCGRSRRAGPSSSARSGSGSSRQLLEPAVHGRRGRGGLRRHGALRGGAARRPACRARPAAARAGGSVRRPRTGSTASTGDLARRRPLALLIDDAHWADARVAAVPGLSREPARASRPSCSSSPRGPLGEPGGAAVADMLARERARAAPPRGAQRRRVGGARARRRPRGRFAALSQPATR